MISGFAAEEDETLIGLSEAHSPWPSTAPQASLSLRTSDSLWVRCRCRRSPCNSVDRGAVGRPAATSATPRARNRRGRRSKAQGLHRRYARATRWGHEQARRARFSPRDSFARRVMRGFGGHRTSRTPLGGTKRSAREVSADQGSRPQAWTRRAETKGPCAWDEEVADVSLCNKWRRGISCPIGTFRRLQDLKEVRGGLPNERTLHGPSRIDPYFD